MRLQIFSCLLDNGFALLGIVCSCYLLTFAIDLFVFFLLTFFFGYMCWEISQVVGCLLTLCMVFIVGQKC